MNRFIIIGFDEMNKVVACKTIRKKEFSILMAQKIMTMMTEKTKNIRHLYLVDYGFAVRVWMFKAIISDNYLDHFAFEEKIDRCGIRLL